MIFLPGRYSNTGCHWKTSRVDELVQKWRAGDPPFFIGHPRLPLGVITRCLSASGPLHMGQNEGKYCIHLHITESEPIKWAEFGFIFDGSMGAKD